MAGELNGERIYKSLGEISKKLDQLLIWKAEHTTAHALIERDVADSRNTLFGNPGIVTKVASLWDSQTKGTKWKDFWIGILKVLIVATIVAVVTWLLVHYKGS